MNETPTRKSTRWPVAIVVSLLVLFTAVFVVAFISITQSEMQPAPEAPADLTADTYMEIVAPLLEDADPENGALLVEKFACIACHRLATQDNMAPYFTGIAERAATQRPPLTAAAYIYESIVNPGVFVLEGYQTIMPQSYHNQLTDRELGDMIAYLLTSDAH